MSSSREELVGPRPNANITARISDEEIRSIYMQAWREACDCAGVKSKEVTRIGYFAVQWPMQPRIETFDVNPPLNNFTYRPFMVVEGRMLGVYQFNEIHFRKNGDVAPVNPRIVMYMTPYEIAYNREMVQQVLVHEFLHHLHFYRMFNDKGFYEANPDSHLWMAKLKEEGCDVHVGQSRHFEGLENRRGSQATPLLPGLQGKMPGRW